MVTLLPVQAAQAHKKGLSGDGSVDYLLREFVGSLEWLFDRAPRELCGLAGWCVVFPPFRNTSVPPGYAAASTNFTR